MRSYNHRSMTRLPEFPNSVRVALRIDPYNGRDQLWAPYVHEGTLVKLVITFEPHDPRLAQLADFAGVKQTIYPTHSPNGYVVFCRLDRPDNTPLSRPRASKPEPYDPPEDEEYDATEASALLHRWLNGRYGY